MTKAPPIQISRWADVEDDNIIVAGGPRPIQMRNSDGTGLPLLKDDLFGADVIRFGPGEGVGNHVHIGAHILFVIKGRGFVDYDGVPHRLEPGLCYLVPKLVDHAIRAETELVLIAVGDDHRPLASEERMSVVGEASRARA